VPPVVVDTNILFSALLRARSSFSEVLLREESQFVVNELVLTELFRHKERIAQLSHLSEDEMVRLYHELVRALDLYKEDLLSPTSRREAYRLCRDVDPSDAPHVAIALELDGLLWTGDEKLKAELRGKGFDAFYDPE